MLPVIEANVSARRKSLSEANRVGQLLKSPEDRYRGGAFCTKTAGASQAAKGTDTGASEKERKP